MPTARGWLVLAGALLGLAAAVLHFLDPFLSVSRPVAAEALIVEGWLPDYALRDAVAEFRRGHYKYIIASGRTLPAHWLGSRFKSAADAAAAVLSAYGLETNQVVAVAPLEDRQDRTYASALAVRAWLEQSHPSLRAVNVYSLGPHARRTWLLYQKALGDKVRVGIIAHPDDDFDPKRWWKSSDGFSEVVGEGIAYLYARLLFHPAPPR